MELTLEQTLQKGIEAHKAGKAQEADRYYTAILKANPKHPDANHNMGVLAVGVGKVEEALPFFKTALEVKPATNQFWLSYIDTLIKLDRMADAKAMLEQARNKGAKGDGFDTLEKKLGLKHKDDSAEIKLQKLMTLYNQKKLVQVFEEAQILTKQDANNLTLWNLMGASASQIGKLEDAVFAFQKAISINPKSPSPYNNMGTALKEQGKLDEAIEAYKKALSINPNLFETLISMGNALKSQGMLDEAIAAYKKALSIKPAYAELYIKIGNVLREQGKLDDAIRAYMRALEYNPGLSEAYNNIGSVFKKLGRFEQAIEAYKSALDYNPDFSEAYNNMGNTYKEQGSLREAIVSYDKADTRSSQAKALECIFLEKNYEEFNKRISAIARDDPKNIGIAAISSFAANQLQQEDLYPFCRDPIDMVVINNIKGQISKANNFLGALLNEMSEVHAVWEPEGKTTKAGFQSNGKLFALATPNLKKLENIIKKELVAYHNSFEKRTDAIIKEWPKEIQLNAWFVRLQKGGHQASHIHPGGWVSGVFYLKTVRSPTENEGAIKFGLHGNNYPVIDHNYPTIEHLPNDGDLVLFPSSLFHETIPVEQDVERCVIAFDMRGT